jgi:lipoprotein-releasing system permease protein
LKFPFYIAKRYFFAKKSHNAINILSWVSILGVAVGTMALIIVLSVFNGLERLILSLFNAFNPDIEITIREGKTFQVSDLPLEELARIPGVAVYSQILEETGLITYRDRQHLITMRGVDDQFVRASGVDTLLVDGEYLLREGDLDYIILGQGVAYMLGANIHDFLNPLTLYIPRRGPVAAMHPAQAFNATSAYASGVFGIQAEFDLEYILVDIELARFLLDYKDEVTAIVVRLTPDANINRVQREIQQLLGNEYQVRDRLQQQQMLYRIMRTEKWAIFFILSFILLIAAFNVTGSISMLVIEKTPDISILKTMGASQHTISRIFLLQGLMISLGGATLGIILGSFVSWLQMRFGIISIQAEGTFIIDAYPVCVQLSDILLVAATVFMIGFVASYIPLKRLKFLNPLPE